MLNARGAYFLIKVYVNEVVEVLLQTVGIANADQATRATIIATILLVATDVVLFAGVSALCPRYFRTSPSTTRVVALVFKIGLDFGFLAVAVLSRGSEIQATEHFAHAGALLAAYGTVLAIGKVVYLVEAVSSGEDAKGRHVRGEDVIGVNTEGPSLCYFRKHAKPRAA